ncbi:prolyl oligopeptidase family protein [Microlunatus capsulatus]|uniref:prolyl oligopeptidase n=1 Tax=Microlunatus capsulatus TaxID=99117 RepID=A0ABS4Z677_9ACTN|nr:prolyl oligopeptidase family serine peptidase [Microlunatus capsulatus]MBP2416551.1 prolyl oligopeptidase [Microlunatus capsulatus]
MVDYPSTRRDDTREQLHGRAVADPYRWLEDPDAAETADWVARQNATSSAYLAALPERAWFGATMAAVLARPRAGTPLHRGGRYLVNRNDGRQDQDVWYIADSLPELLEGGRVLVDPNTFSADGTSSLAALAVRRDGAQLAYAVSEGGSDWHTFHLLDVESGAEVPDVGVQTKFSEAVWLPDGRSFVYTAFDHEGHAEGTQTSALAGGKLRLHRVGRPVAEDELLLEFSDERLMLWAETTDDDRWLVVSIVAGTENQNRLWAYPVTTDDGASALGEPLKVVDEPVAEFTLVRSEGSTLYLSTDDEAERGRVVAVDLEAVRRGRDDAWREVLAETEHTLGQVVAAGDGFVTVHLVDAQPRVSRYDLHGRLLGPVDLPAGAVVGLEGHAGDDEVFVGLSSVVSPTAAHLVHFGSGEVTPLPGLVRGAGGGFVPPEVTVERSAATSADGTRVPYFLIRAAGADADAPRPTLLWGYGGFKIPLFADYRPGWAGWLAAGGVLAIANLRGGGEYGTEWYEAGRLSRKQNVFDDFVAVAEHLQSTGVTTREQLALHGRSNGGLLVGAVMTQRPDLAAVALPGVGVLDMLRFHLFTVGAAWISDYGDPRDPAQFADALAYSPLHAVRPGTRYPATLVVTGDHDDRVVPLHSHKFVATLQHAQAGDAPVLTRVEVATGHGAGKPAALQAAEWADLLAFAAHHTGLVPPAA